MWKRIIAPALVVSILWLAGSSISTYYFHRVYESHVRVLAENVATIRAAWAMQDALWRLHAVVMEATDKERRETRSEATEMESVFDRHWAEADQSAYTPEEKVLVKAVQDHYIVYRDHIEARLKPQGLSGLLTSQTAEKEKTIRLARAVAEPCRQLVELNEKMLADSTARSSQLSTLVNAIRFSFLIAGPIVGVLFGLWIARGLHRSISQISVTLSDATGDLNRNIGSVEIRNLSDLPGLHQQVQAVAAGIRQVMEELEQARRHAMLSERLAAVGELAAGVAHELRNPLTSVKLLIQTAAQRQPNTAMGGRQLQVVQQEIARMESTIQGLLDFARPPELHRIAHDLRTTVRRALNLVEGRAKQQNVEISERVPKFPVVVSGDPEQLHQILINLLLNGIEAMPQGGPLVMDVEADEPGHVCRVTVSDSGDGIPQEILDRIFEPFATSKEHGTGLGLAISHRIAKEHGGVLLAANRTQRGAVFTLELPLSMEQPNGEITGN
jgi:two-component system, NtrC family, sensor histidine kinase HydH